MSNINNMMSDTVNNKNTLILLEKFLGNFPEKYHFRLHKCFNVTVRERWGFSERTVNDLHLIYVKGGRGFYKLEDKTEILEKGKVIFLSNGFRHSSGHYHRAPYPRIIPVRFGVYSNATGQLAGDPFNSPPVSICLANQSSYLLPDLFEELYDCFCLRESEQKKLKANLLLLQIMLEIYNFLKNRELIKDHRIDRVRRYIIKHPETRKSLDELAKMAGLTQKYFTGLFRRETGTTPIDFIIRERCRAAEYLLQNSLMIIKEIAERLGYPNQYAFSKQFRQVTGHPPAEIMKKRKSDMFQPGKEH